MRRSRPARAPRAPRPPGTRQTTVGAVGGGELVQAAEEIADGARSNASWSTTIPGNIRTEQVSEKQVNVVADAPAAYPAETRARHPLFGNRQYWFGPPGARFMGPAADDRAGPALAKYAEKVDRLCREAGFH
jgi:hypothetical protein